MNDYSRRIHHPNGAPNTQHQNGSYSSQPNHNVSSSNLFPIYQRSIDSGAANGPSLSNCANNVEAVIKSPTTSSEVLSHYYNNTQLFNSSPHLFVTAIRKLSDLRYQDPFTDNDIPLFVILIRHMIGTIERFDAQLLAELSRNLAKLKGSNEPLFQPILDESFFGKIARVAIGKIGFCQHRQVTSISWAFSVAKMPFLDLYRAIEASVLRNIRRYSSRELVTIFKPFAKFKINAPSLLMEMCESIQKELSTAANNKGIESRDLADLAWSLAIFGCRHEKLLATLANIPYHQIKALNADNLAIFCWAFAALNFKNDHLLNHISMAAQDRVAEFNENAQASCILVLAFEMVQAQIPPFLANCGYEREELRKIALKNLFEGNAFTQLNAVTARASTTNPACQIPVVINDRLVNAKNSQAVFDICDDHLKDFNCVNITTALSRFALFGMKLNLFPQNGSRIHREMIFFDLLGKASDEIHTFRSGELASLANSLSKLKVGNSDIYDKIAKAAFPKIDSFDHEQITSITWAFAKAQVMSPSLSELIPKIVNFVENNMTRFPLREYGTIIKSLAILNVTVPTSLLAKINDKLPSDLTRQDPRTMNDYAFAFRSLGMPVGQFPNCDRVLLSTSDPEENSTKCEQALVSSGGSLNFTSDDETSKEQPMGSSCDFSLASLVSESQKEMEAELKINRDLQQTLAFCDKNMHVLETSQIANMFTVISEKSKSENKSPRQYQPQEQEILGRLHAVATKSIHLQNYTAQQRTDLRRVSAQLGLPFQVFGERL